MRHRHQIKAAHTSKHGASDAWRGFSPDGIYKMVTGALRRVASDQTVDLTPQERERLAGIGVHALRHTIGTLAVSKGMSLHVVQRILGHASLNTTTIYVQSEDEQAAQEAAEVFMAAVGSTED